MKDNFIPLLKLLAGAVAMYCAIMYISSGMIIPVLSPLSLSFLMLLTIYSEKQSHNRGWLKTALFIGTVLCLACAVAQIMDYI